jgi:hypothetical protein
LGFELKNVVPIVMKKTENKGEVENEILVVN